MFILNPLSAAVLWKDDFSDELIHELLWDMKNTTGTTRLENKRCILNIEDKNPGLEEAMITLPSRSLPPNFDLHTAIEFTNVDTGKGEFYINIGDRMELVISFGQSRFFPSGKETDSNKKIYLIDFKRQTIITQASGNVSFYPHKISSGERQFVSWLSNGETPAQQIIKVGNAPGESNIADFVIETKEPVSGPVEIGIRDGIREIRLNYIRAYLYGTSSSLVQDWVLF
ncbi:hypothetical protein JW926_10280 [Candidatus Sumerlaeota bacterium]|nr:hypothetical protein [Candidatus Sumerlaeota bacterium]